MTTASYPALLRRDPRFPLAWAEAAYPVRGLFPITENYPVFVNPSDLHSEKVVSSLKVNAINPGHKGAVLRINTCEFEFGDLSEDLRFLLRGEGGIFVNLLFHPVRGRRNVGCFGPES